MFFLHKFLTCSASFKPKKWWLISTLFKKIVAGVLSPAMSFTVTMDMKMLYINSLLTSPLHTYPFPLTDLVAESSQCLACGLAIKVVKCDHSYV